MKFKKGDRVKVVGNRSGGIRHYISIGSICYVVNLGITGELTVRVNLNQQIIHEDDLFVDEDYILDLKLREL